MTLGRVVIGGLRERILIASNFVVRRNSYAASRYWQYRVHDFMHQPGHADDTRPRIFLWRSGRAEECARHHDSEFCLDGLDDGDLVFIRLFAVFQRRLAWGHRQLPPGIRSEEHT